MDYFNYNQIQSLPSTYYGVPTSATIDATVPHPPPKPKAETKPDEPSELRFVKPATPQSKTTLFPWMPVLLGTVAVTAMGVGIYALANRNKATEVANKAIEKTPLVMDAMHNVFANATDFLPYQVNVLNPSKLNGNEATDAIGYLEAVKKLKTADNLYLGDLHGAWQKLLQHLSMAELIQMPEATAKEFVAIHKLLEGLETIPTKGGSNNYAQLYSQADLPKAVQAIERFKVALDQVQFIDDKRGLHLVGDILADRGQSDFAMLLLLEKMQPKIKSMVLSNHDLDALYAYRQQVLLKKDPKLTPLNLCNDPQRVKRAAGQAQSSSLAYQVAETNPDLMQELTTLASNHFKRLKLIHYDPDTETLMLHSALAPAQAEKLLKAYIPDAKQRALVQAHLKTGTMAEYAQAVDTLNQGFQKHLQENWLKDPNDQTLAQHDSGIFYAIYMQDARRKFETEALVTDKEFPFYNPNAVKNIAFGHDHNDDESPIVVAKQLEGIPIFYMLDQYACKPGVDKDEQFSRVFSPSLVNQAPFSAVA